MFGFHCELAGCCLVYIMVITDVIAWLAISIYMEPTGEDLSLELNIFNWNTNYKRYYKQIFLSLDPHNVVL